MDIIGKTITGIEQMTKEETSELGWDRPGIKILLDDGTVLIPMRDDEGNGAGEITIINPK